MKDQVRRQIEESHLELKKTFNGFTDQVDSFQQSVENTKGQAGILQGEIRQAFAKMEFTQRNIDKAIQRMEDMNEEKVSVEAFEKWKKVMDKEGQIRLEAINKLEK